MVGVAKSSIGKSATTMIRRIMENLPCMRIRLALAVRYSGLPSSTWTQCGPFDDAKEEARPARPGQVLHPRGDDGAKRYCFV